MQTPPARTGPTPAGVVFIGIGLLLGAWLKSLSARGFGGFDLLLAVIGGAIFVAGIVLLAARR